MRLTSKELTRFRSRVYRYYRTHRRDLPWRTTINPYRILVSEIMLQQTQVDRVVDKYKAFIKKFPDFKSLNKASQAEVLRAWQGLGYNRRALHLHQAAKKVIKDFGGKLPQTVEGLVHLPGIGRNTAGAICAFAFNLPVVFIETNIRSVLIHFFFADKKNITDEQILPLVEKTLDRKNPRAWYSAFMDYGSMLKKTHPNPSRKSAHYAKQSRFEGSNRQLRGKIVKMLLKHRVLSCQKLYFLLNAEPAKIMANLRQLKKEGFLVLGGKEGQIGAMKLPAASCGVFGEEE